MTEQDYKQLCEKLTTSEQLIKDKFRDVAIYLHAIEHDIEKLRKSINKFLMEKAMKRQ
jgi:hypothetical protein